MHRLFVLLYIILHFSPLFTAAEPIKLGLLTDLSGKTAMWGEQSKVGAELAQAELAESGIEVQVIIGDHKFDPKSAISEAQKQISVDRVQAIMCDLTPTSIVVSPIVLKEGKLFLYQSPAESILEKNPYAFRNFLDYVSGCRAIAEQFKRLGLSKIGHFKANAEYGELCLSGAQQIFPDQEVVDYDLGEDLRSAVTRFKSKGIQAVLQTGTEGEAINRFKIEQQIQYFPYGGFVEIILTQLARQHGQKNLENLVTFGFEDINPDFIKRVLKRYPNNSLVNLDFAAIAYLHVKLLTQAIIECKSAPTQDRLDCERAELIKAGPDSTMGFKGWPDRKAVYHHVVKVWQGGKSVPVL